MLSSLESHCVLMSHGSVLSLKKQKQNIPLNLSGARTGLSVEAGNAQRKTLKDLRNPGEILLKTT